MGRYNQARESAEIRAKEAIENHLEALVLEPTRHRHVSVAAAMLAHASVGNAAGGDAEWRSAVGRGLHSSTLELKLSALYGIGGAQRGCVVRISEVLGGV